MRLRKHGKRKRDSREDQKMNLKSITTLGIMSFTMAATSYAPAEANSMEKYLNIVAMQNLINQQAADAAAAAQAAATPVTPPPAATPAATASVVTCSPSYKARIDDERLRIVREIYDQNYRMNQGTLSPRAYARAKSKVAYLNKRLERINSLGI